MTNQRGIGPGAACSLASWAFWVWRKCRGLFFEVFYDVVFLCLVEQRPGFWGQLVDSEFMSELFIGIHWWCWTRSVCRCSKSWIWLPHHLPTICFKEKCSAHPIFFGVWCWCNLDFVHGFWRPLRGAGIDSSYWGWKAKGRKKRNLRPLLL